MHSYEVVDLRPDSAEEARTVVSARSPESAAGSVLGLEVVRSGQKKDLVAKVYWQLPDQPKNLVRLYARLDHRILEAAE